MEILFLGTSAAWPLPRLGCTCKICASPDSHDKRLRSCILINRSLLIDAGPDIYHQLLSLNAKYYSPRPRLGSAEGGLNTVFLTHAHLDHLQGLFDLTHLYLPHTKRRRLKPTLLTAKKVLKQAKKLFDFQLKQYFNLQLINYYQQLTIQQLTINAFRVDHSTGTETFGLVIGERRKKFVYIPDFRQIPPKSLKSLKNADLALLDGSSTKPAGPARWGHMPIEKSIKLAKKLKIKKVYYTHIGHGPKSGTHEELEAFVQNKGGKNFHIAYDGLKLIL